MNTTDKVKEIISDVFEKEFDNEWDFGSRFNEDLNADSLDIIDIACKVEDEFDVNLNETDIKDMTKGTVNDMLVFIEDMLKEFDQI